MLVIFFAKLSCLLVVIIQLSCLLIVIIHACLCRLNSTAKSLNPAHEFADHIASDPPNVFYCKICKHKITVRIARLKHHFADTKSELVKTCCWSRKEKGVSSP